MFPIIDKRETGINIRKIMDRQGTDGKTVKRWHTYKILNRKSHNHW